MPRNGERKRERDEAHKDTHPMVAISWSYETPELLSYMMDNPDREKDYRHAVLFACRGCHKIEVYRPGKYDRNTPQGMTREQFLAMAKKGQSWIETPNWRDHTDEKALAQWDSKHSGGRVDRAETVAIAA